MAAGIKRAHGETERHARLKRLAFLWAQTQDYSACAMEVSLPKCRYRADVAAYRLTPKRIGSTAIFECKQALCDLRRDNCQSDAARQRLETICQRRQLLEECLRAHYPSLRNGDSLFPEFDLHDFTAMGTRPTISNSPFPGKSARANCARSSPSVVAVQAKTKELAPGRLEFRLRTEIAQHRWPRK